MNAVDTLGWPVIAVVVLVVLAVSTTNEGFDIGLRIALLVALPWVLARAITKHDVISILATIALAGACIALQTWWPLALAGIVLGVLGLVGSISYFTGRAWLAGYKKKSERP